MTNYNELIESLRSMEPMVCSTAADAIEALQSRVGELESERAEREKQKPAALIDDDECFQGPCRHATAFVPMPRGTPLYAAPPVTVPVRLAEDAMLEDINETAMSKQAACGYPSPRNMVELCKAVETAVLRANGFKVEE